MSESEATVDGAFGPLPDTTTLIQLDEHFHLSTRAWNVCNRHGVTTLGQLRSVARSRLGFLELAGCGKGTIVELEDLLAKADRVAVDAQEEPARIEESQAQGEHGSATGNDTPQVEGDPDLEQIAAIFGISVRAFNVCEGAGLMSLSAISAFHSKHDGFKALRNCGSKTQLELEDILARARALGYVGEQVTTELMTGSNEWLEHFFNVQYQGLTARSRNVLAALMGPPTAKGAIQFFKRYGTRWSAQPRVGVKVRSELRELRRQLLDALIRQNSIAVTSTLDGTALSPIEMWYLRHNIPAEAWEVLFDPDGRMNLFRFLQSYLELTGTNSKIQVRAAYLQGYTEPFSYQAIAARTGLTRERVRQLLINMDREFPPSLSMLADLPDVQRHYPELVADTPGYMVDQELTAKLNTREITSWAPLFFLYVANVVSGARHQRVLWTDLFDRTAVSRELDLSTPFMVERALVPYLSKATTSLAEQVDRKRGLVETLDLGATLGNLEPEKRVSAFSILEQIIPIRYPGFTVTDGIVSLPPNRKRNQDELLEEVLLVLNEPSHVSRVVEEWARLFPDDPISESVVRSVVVREKDRFFSIGRSSTYGLRRWEQERPEIKGGTIRDLAEEFLLSAEAPVHVDDLTVAIQRYRPTTNSASVRLNLQLGQGERFIVSSDGFIGLTGKLYSHVPEPRPRVQGNYLRRSALRAFIGRKLETLIEQINAKCGAGVERVRVAVHAKVADGTLVVDAEGHIIAVGVPYAPGLKRPNLEQLCNAIAVLLKESRYPQHIDKLVDNVKASHPLINSTSLLQSLAETDGFSFFQKGYIGIIDRHYDLLPGVLDRLPGSHLRYASLLSFNGQQLEDLIAHVSRRSDAEPALVRNKVERLVQQGTIEVNEAGTITAVMRPELDEDVEDEQGTKAPGELPFGW